MWGLQGIFCKNEKIDEQIAELLNQIHGKLSAQVNKARKESDPFRIMDKDWYLCSPDLGEKLDSRCLGPELVVWMEGNRPYVVEVKRVTPYQHIGASLSHMWMTPPRRVI